jgi:hypothetical protein
VRRPSLRQPASGAEPCAGVRRGQARGPAARATHPPGPERTRAAIASWTRAIPPPGPGRTGPVRRGARLPGHPPARAGPDPFGHRQLDSGHPPARAGPNPCGAARRAGQVDGLMRARGTDRCGPGGQTDAGRGTD